MEIKSVKETKFGFSVNDGEVFVPQDSSNHHYQQIQKWISAGGVIDKGNLLSEIKSEKISRLKSIRDQKNTEPITDHKAFLLDDDGNRTSEESFFLFYTNRHQTNPTSDPDSIINRAIETGSMPYFTKDLQGNRTTIELTAELARSLRQTIASRNDANYRITLDAEAAIKSANTIEEVESIAIEFPN